MRVYRAGPGPLLCLSFPFPQRAQTPFQEAATPWAPSRRWAQGCHGGGCGAGGAPGGLGGPRWRPGSITRAGGGVPGGRGGAP